MSEIPAYGGARSRWLTAQPAIEIPERPTAKTIMVTAPALSQMKPVATRQIAGPMNPVNKRQDTISTLIN